MSKPLVPLFLDLEGARVVVTGGGPEAFEAAARLTAAGARVLLACPDEAAARSACATCDAEYVEGPADSAPLEGAALLVAASTEPAADVGILAAAAARGLLAVSANGAPARGVLGTARTQDRIAVAATTSGLCPELEARLAGEAGRLLVPRLETYAEILGNVRGRLSERFPDAARREAIWGQIFESPVLALLQAGDEDEAVELAERMAWGTG